MLTAQANEYYVQVDSYQSTALAETAKKGFTARGGMEKSIIADSILGDTNMPVGIFVPVDLSGRLRITVGPKTSGVIALEDITGIVE